jgi:hypothetical protein
MNKERAKVIKMERQLNSRLVTCVLVLVLASSIFVFAGDVIVKEGRIGTGNPSPSPNAKLFVSDNATDTTYGYGLITVTTNSDSGTQTNRGVLCEFFPNASDTTSQGKTGGAFFNYPVGTEGKDIAIYYALYGGTSARTGYSNNGKNVYLYGIGLGVQNPNSVTGGGTFSRNYRTCGVNVYSQPVDHGYAMTNKLNMKNYGIYVLAKLDGSYQSSKPGENYGIYVGTEDNLDAAADPNYIISYALYLKPFTSNGKLGNGGKTYGIYQEGPGVENWFDGSISAQDVTDRTPAYSGSPQDALSEILNIVRANGEIVHSSLPKLAQVKVSRVEKTNRQIIERTDPSGNVFEEEVYDLNIVEEEGRSLSGMVTVTVEAIKCLSDKIETLEAENQMLKAELAAIKAKLGMQ